MTALKIVLLTAFLIITLFLGKLSADMQIQKYTGKSLWEIQHMVEKCEKSLSRNYECVVQLKPFVQEIQQ